MPNSNPLNHAVILKILSILVFGFTLFFSGVTKSKLDTPSPQNNTNIDINKPLFKPFIERYVLDELKLLRLEQSAIRIELTEKVAHARLDSSDRAIRYTADTTNNIFYIITASATLLVLLGWKSIRDLKKNIASTTTKKVEELTAEYESRLNTLESTIKERSEQIIATQKKMSDHNLIHSLWMRAGLEKSDQEKIKIYDQILEINASDIEALTYKADVLLDMDEISWALSLTNEALDQDDQYALAYWQRACCHSKLEQEDDAIEDIVKALELSSYLKNELSNEPNFINLQNNPTFLSLKV